jgi:DNA-binding CsgD family transcriptional regulator
VNEPFVGRVAERSDLDRQFELAAAGQGRVVVIEGPAGGGKTALIWRCLQGWAGRAETVLLSGDETELALAGGLLSQLVEQSGGADGAELAALLAGGHADPLSAGSAVLTLLRAHVGAPPLVVVVDDAQWGDDLSLRALSFAARRLAADPVLCVVACRPDALARLPAGLVRAAAERGTRLSLAGLDAAEVAELAELTELTELTRSPGPPAGGRLSGRAAERLREHTDGIPLYVRELLHDLPGQMLRAPGVALPAPRSLQALVGSRLTACTADTESLVVAAAVLGADCDLADAAALARLNDPLPALQEAIGQRLLAEPPAAGRRRIAFPHALIRTAVYQDIGVARRAALHRAAAALTVGSAALAHRVAGSAGADSQLAGELAASAAAACANGQLIVAAENLLMAVQLADTQRTAEGWLAEAVALLIDAGDAGRAREYAEQVRAMTPSARRDLLLGRLDLLAGAGAPAEERISGAWAAAVADNGGEAREPAREAAAKAACELALVLAGQQRLTDAASWARRSAATAVSWYTRGCSRAVEASTLALTGQARRARTLLEGELTRCTDDAARAMLHAGLGGALLYADDLRGAAEHLAAARAGEALLPMTHLLEHRLLDVTLAYRAGHWDEAAAGSERLVLLIDDLDQGWQLGRAHLAAVYAAAGRGQWETAARHAAAAAGRPGAGTFALAEARTAIAVARDDLAAMLAAGADAAVDPVRLRRMEPARLTFWPAYAAALARAGEHAKAAATLVPYERRAAACGRRSAMAAASRARGILHAARHQDEDALAAFGTSLAHLDGLGMPFEEAMTHLERGRLQRRAGQRRAAARDIGAARVLFGGLGAEPFLVRCDQELGASPAPAQGQGQGQGHGHARPPLTARQLSVAQAAAAGKTNRQIAAELYISVKTVEFHLAQIMARLDVDSRTEIARALAAPRP